MENYEIGFWGSFNDKKVESRYHKQIKEDILSQNKWSILVAGIGYSIVVIADLCKLGLCRNFCFTASARLLFLLFCILIFFKFTKPIRRKIYVNYSFAFAIGNTILLLFVIYMLNPLKEISLIDTITIPFITMMAIVFIQIPLRLLFYNALFALVGFMAILMFHFSVSVDTFINLFALFIVLLFSGLFLARVNKVSRRKLFVQTQQISDLNLILNEEILQKQQAETALNNAYNELQESILYAKNLQMATFPSDKKIQAILTDYFIMFKPKDVVSGDFYWVKSFANKTVIAVADCTGHGIPGAFMSILGISLLNIIVKEYKKNGEEIIASQVLDDLRHDVLSTIRQTFDDADRKDGMDISLCIIDYSKNEMQFAGAYNDLWLIRDTITEPVLQVYKGDRMPIGLHDSTKEFTNTVIPIQNNDVIILSTDGFKDQFGGIKGQKFKSKKLMDLLVSSSKKTMLEQGEILESTFEKWKEKNEQVDDVLVMGVRLHLDK